MFRKTISLSFQMEVYESCSEDWIGYGLHFRISSNGAWKYKYLTSYVRLYGTLRSKPRNTNADSGDSPVEPETE